MTRPGSRRGGAVLLLLALALGLLGPVAPAHGQTTSAPSVSVELVSQTPFVVAGEDAVLHLKVVGARPGDKIKATMWEHANRDQLREGLATGDLLKTGLVRVLPYRADIQAGASTLTIPDKFAQGKPGVYPVELTIVDADGDESDTLLTTTFVRIGPLDTAAGPLDVALVVPLRAATAHRPDGTFVVEPAERERLLALASLATRYPDIPFAFEPNPETMDALAHGGPDDIAAFNDLASAIREHTVLGTTYVPVDEEAMRRAGLDLMVTDLQGAGLESLRETIGPSDETIARTDPTDTADTLSLRETLGVSQILADAEHLEPLDDETYPATLLQSFVLESSAGVRLKAMASDGHLTEIAATLADPEAVDEQPLNRQTFLADMLAGYYDDATTTGRATVLVLPDDWDPVAADADALLATLTSPSLPQLQFSDLAAVFESVSAAAPLGEEDSTSDESEPLVRSFRAQSPPDLRSYGEREAQTDRRLQGYYSVVGTAPTPQSIGLDKLRLASADERLDDADRRAYLAAVDQLVAAALRAPDGGPGFVGPGRQQVTMTSRTVSIPIQIDNRLGVDATVRIELRSEKLDFPEGWLRETTLTPGTNTIEFAVESKTSGDSVLEVTVLAPDVDAGLGSLADGTYRVRSTALSGVGLVLGVVAIIVLMTWWGRHVLRVRRARRSPSEDDDDDEIAGQDEGTTPSPSSSDERPVDASPNGARVEEAPRPLTRTET